MDKEKFNVMAKKIFMDRMAAIDNEDVERYLQCEEASEIISEAFESAKNKLETKSDDLSEDAFWKSCASSAAHCMTLCYE